MAFCLGGRSKYNTWTHEPSWFVWLTLKMEHKNGTQVINKFFTKKEYSCDIIAYLNPCGYFMFWKIKTQLCGCYLGTVKNRKQVLMNQLKAVTVEDFQHCFQESEHLWNYFEGDKVDNLRKKKMTQSVSLILNVYTLIGRGKDGISRYWDKIQHRKEQVL